MEMKWSAKLRAAWGDKPCDHPEIAEERECDGDTGEYVCITCGRGERRPDWNKEKP
jgi:hypothetical protein